MNKLNTMFLNEYNKADELCRGKFGSDDGVAKYISEMEGASDNKAKIANWDEDYHTLGKCMHIYNVINIQQNMRRKAQCTKQDLAWIKKFVTKLEKGSDPIEKLKKYEEMLAKLKETLAKVRPAAKNIAIGAGATLLVTSILSKKKNKKD